MGVGSQRGMVTVELALVSVLVAGAGGLAGWFAVQLMIIDRCQIVAHQVARQAARDDVVGVRRAAAEAPPGASVAITEAGGMTTVVVRFVPSVLGVSVGGVETRASVLNEARP